MTDNDIYKDAQELFDSFHNFRDQRKKWLDIIKRVDVIDLGKLYHDVGLRYHSFRPQHELSQFTAVLDTASTTVNVNARSEDREDKEAAQNFEDWSNAIIPRLGQGKSSPRRLSRSYRASVGVSVEKFDLAREWLKRGDPRGADAKSALGADEAEKVRLGPPFIWTSINPLTGAWFEDDLGVHNVVEQSERAINPILKEFKLGYRNGGFTSLGAGDPEGIGYTGWTKKAKFTQVSTPDSIYCFVEGAKGKGHMVAQYENPWGRPPYEIVPALLQGDLSDPDTRYIPLILGSLVQAEYENFVMSLVFLAAYLTGSPVYDLFTKTGAPFFYADRNEQISIEIKPGEPSKYQFPEGSELRQRTIQMGVDVDKFLVQLRQDAERYGFPTSLTGSTPEARTPAWALAEASGKAMFQIDPATRAEQQSIVGMLEGFGHVIKTYIQEPVPILSRVEGPEGKAEDKLLTVKHTDIRDFDIAVGVSVPSSSLQLAKQEVGRKDVAEGHLSEETYQEEYIGLKNVARENRRILDGELRKMLKPSIVAHAIQVINKRVQEETGSTIPVPQAVPPAPQGVAAPKTRPAQQVRPGGAGGAESPMEAMVG